MGLELEGSDEPSKFKDVDNQAWYAPAIEAAVKAELVSGVTQDHFAPNMSITREQMATMIAKAMSFVGETVSVSDQDILAAFSDRSSISEWAETAMRIMVQEDIMNGVKADELAPASFATRAQAATMLQRFMVYVGFIEEE